MKKPLWTLLSLLAVALVLASCDGFLEKENRNNVNAENFYQTDDQAVAGVNAIYSQLQSQGLWGRSIFFMLDFAGQEVGTTANTQGAPLDLLNHNYQSSGNTHVEQPWVRTYDMIAKANAAIMNIQEMEDIDAALQSRLIGEARFLRGLGYFYINAMYGGGPLRTVENMEQTNVPRAAPAEIWDYAEGDLSAAAEALPQRGEYNDSEEGRATSGAAWAQLGKAHLYQEEWADAEAAFQAVVDQGAYALVQAGDYGGDPVAAMRSNHDPQVDNNAESVFEVQFSAGTGFGWALDGTGRNETSIRPQEYGVDGFAFYNAVPAADLIDAYDEDDPRLGAFYFGPSSTYQNDPYPFEEKGWAWKKYQKTDEAELSESDANMDVIRYADVLLMMAEAQIQQGNVAGGVDLINTVRERADPSGDVLERYDDGASPSQAMDWLMEERRLELAGEQTRFFDMVRWGRAADAWATFDGGQHEVFPIPQTEINANTEISQDDQNPGYQ